MLHLLTSWTEKTLTLTMFLTDIENSFLAMNKQTL